MRLERQIRLTAILLIVSILFFGISSVDLDIQNLFYDADHRSWILDKHAQPWRILFYSGLKRILILFGIALLLFALMMRKKAWFIPYKRGILIVLLSSVIVPTVAVTLKETTNMPCPKDELHYGGDRPRIALWQHYPRSIDALPKTKCWPAGHASGGFALMSLFFLFRRRRNKYLALAAGIVLGWIMGLYKMAIGDHFFSHTWIMMLLAWLIILLIAYAVERLGSSSHKKEAS